MRSTVTHTWASQKTPGKVRRCPGAGAAVGPQPVCPAPLCRLVRLWLLPHRCCPVICTCCSLSRNACWCGSGPRGSSSQGTLPPLELLCSAARWQPWATLCSAAGVRLQGLAHVQVEASVTQPEKLYRQAGRIARLCKGGGAGGGGLFASSFRCARPFVCGPCHAHTLGASSAQVRYGLDAAPAPACSTVTNSFSFLFMFDLRRDPATGACIPPKQVLPTTGGTLVCVCVCVCAPLRCASRAWRAPRQVAPRAGVLATSSLSMALPGGASAGMGAPYAATTCPRRCVPLYQLHACQP